MMRETYKIISLRRTNLIEHSYLAERDNLSFVPDPEVVREIRDMHEDYMRKHEEVKRMKTIAKSAGRI